MENRVFSVGVQCSATTRITRESRNFRQEGYNFSKMLISKKKKKKKKTREGGGGLGNGGLWLFFFLAEEWFDFPDNYLHTSLFSGGGGVGHGKSLSTQIHR